MITTGMETLADAIDALEIDTVFMIDEKRGAVITSDVRSIDAAIPHASEDQRHAVYAFLRNTYAPDVIGVPSDGQGTSLDGLEGWRVMSGWTNQQGGGDILHNSEHMSSGMADWMVEQSTERPTMWAVVAVYWDWCDECEEHADYCTEDGHEATTEPEGWVMAYKFLDV